MAGRGDISMLIGLPVSALAYIWVSRSLDIEAERRIIATADRGLEEEALADPAHVPDGYGIKLAMGA